jgi:hypothetical protein
VEGIKILRRNECPASYAVHRALKRTARDYESELPNGLQRYAARSRRSGYARLGMDMLDTVSNETSQFRSFFESLASERHLHHEHIAGIEARIHRAQSYQRANQQSSTHNKDQGQRDLAHNQQRTCSILAKTAAASSTSFFKGRAEINAGRLECWNQAKQECG